MSAVTEQALERSAAGDRYADYCLWDYPPVVPPHGKLRCGLDLLSRACRRTPAGNLFLMAVEEPGNPRQSYDINVYQADLHVRDIADLVGSLARDFAVPLPQVHALIDRSGALALGHLAGGRGSDGVEFVTVYYGVEAH